MQMPASAALPTTRLRAIGYWVDDDQPELPDPASFIDLDWTLTERQAVANYLSAGRPTVAATGCSPCRVCGTPNGFEEFTDGVFLWPEGLAHYVLDHAVRLPDEVVQHVLHAADSGHTVGLVETGGLVDKTWWKAMTGPDSPART